MNAAYVLLSLSLYHLRLKSAPVQTGVRWPYWRPGLALRVLIGAAQSPYVLSGMPFLVCVASIAALWRSHGPVVAVLGGAAAAVASYVLFIFIALQWWGS